MPAFLTLALLKRAAPYLLAALAIGLVLWVDGLRRDVASQKATIGDLKTELAAEQAARTRDVAGLTTLGQGLVAASSSKAIDQQALQETINVQHPQPASPGLAALLGRLRDADAAGGPKRAAAGTGSPAGTTAAGSH